MDSNMNIFQMMQMIKGSKNPQAFALNMLEQQAGNNPLFSNLLNLARQGKTADIQTIVENMCKERGVDFNKEFSSFRSSFGL